MINNVSNYLSLLKSNIMRRQLSNFMALNLKALFILISVSVGFTGFTKCQAQAIVGKWKGVSLKYFYSPAGAKQEFKQMEEAQSKEMGNSGYEFKSDHTYIFFPLSALNITKSKGITMKGTWSLSGDQLTKTWDAHQPDPELNPEEGEATVNATIQIRGNTLIVTEVMPKSNPMVNKIEYTFKKM